VVSHPFELHQLSMGIVRAVDEAMQLPPARQSSCRDFARWRRGSCPA
jgi:hypothetical protein